MALEKSEKRIILNVKLFTLITVNQLTDYGQ